LWGGCTTGWCLHRAKAHRVDDLGDRAGGRQRCAPQTRVGGANIAAETTQVHTAAEQASKDKGESTGDQRTKATQQHSISSNKAAEQHSSRATEQQNRATEQQSNRAAKCGRAATENENSNGERKQQRRTKTATGKGSGRHQTQPRGIYWKPASPTSW
jgi:hypothetical protein